MSTDNRAHPVKNDNPIRYCHLHGKHKCQDCIDSWTAEGIQADKEEIAKLKSMIDRLNCNSISCHYQKDILESIYEAMAVLPCNGIQGILCGAAQEIQALRDAATGTAK